MHRIVVLVKTYAHFWKMHSALELSCGIPHAANIDCRNAGSKIHNSCKESRKRPSMTVRIARWPASSSSGKPRMDRIINTMGGRARFILWSDFESRCEGIRGIFWNNSLGISRWNLNLGRTESRPEERHGNWKIIRTTWCFMESLHTRNVHITCSAFR